VCQIGDVNLVINVCVTLHNFMQRRYGILPEGKILDVADRHNEGMLHGSEDDEDEPSIPAEEDNVEASPAGIDVEALPEEGDVTAKTWRANLATRMWQEYQQYKVLLKADEVRMQAEFDRAAKLKESCPRDSCYGFEQRLGLN